ncbi:undecaprenyldiphospho-muramoylpentapeptide beta-N-acetylglucosaminyltransferase [candidate division WOR-1 bacterium RIFOXYA12_FULL_52_29]|uniref:UDP-N-acetylglucosamine--N-acetylmuramyl-(pentapeptide) pyrophosphoryl-undecaprenol N-acetylglucosamine transferase n=1 Tax=candidate division WOR-1 bacterium RIFOXYC12_FULL_54_18 TaxID=1802584 RepID=A0A1F4T4Y0_UNCSA|nr:MAG: undecaprenyldiphospho-muramoylpentapeptide beta-N-acetylglucosaminyltransferase [candidate division WOR-1 bacterium RIFOXYA2_FULL_51_19]OGC17351.1 MAG: undecaprenyldiphospho-muramoylpentapeptide beta-N-acetylglucosaminyltransferase [candidate division WOR-1 bacterium RIFOXYA12_FULL_52_29]OGC26210.1 MAG: undecaprenyldiphospho-muramoylpentapeptide beta-N-acetylglucosaminyltransferase [candidate division WOR-1 bacterium RIFOXYB2_FULL_45_9]OGC27768.1 MAG: undecaprenyldiphospho-muramoylpentap
MKIVIVSGGTGGHIYPGIAVARELIPENKVLFIGSEEGLEKGLIAKAGFPIKLIKSRALLRKLSYKALSAPFISLIGFFQALAYLVRERPNVLLSTGGYASLPVVLAAKFLSIPIYLHEQNVLPGVTNRLFARWAKKVFLSFDRSREYLPQGIVTGNPVRGEIALADREASRALFGCEPGDKMVLVVGGSQGARSVNQAVIAALPLIKEGIKIVHIIGSRDFPLLKRSEYPFYKPVEYMYNIAEAIAAADLVVSRAGATAIAEFLVRGLPMVLVPFPYSAEGHQDLNARVVEEAGAGVLVKNGELTPEKFASLVNDSLDLKQMKEACRRLARPEAAQEIINAIRF